MKTAAELFKERMEIRSTDPDRSNLIMIVISGAKVIAKTAGREPENQDLLDSVRALIKMNRKSVVELAEKNVDFARYERELQMLLDLLPPQLSESETQDLILSKYQETELTRKNRKNIEQALKSNESLDWNIVSDVLGKVLK
jgi:hypothetical protein